MINQKTALLTSLAIIVAALFSPILLFILIIPAALYFIGKKRRL